MRKPNPVSRMKALVEALPGSEFHTSARGVPMAVVGNRSVCWFGKSQVYRVFDSYQKPEPGERRDYPDVAGVVGHFASLQSSPAVEFDVRDPEP